MRARRFAVFAACTLSLLAASLQCTLAADKVLPRKAVVKAPPRPSNPWDGFYLGGEFGFDAAAAKYVRPFTGQADIWIGSVNRGLIWRGYGGYNLQVLPSLVLGLEGALSTSRAHYRELGPDQDFLQDSKFVGSVAGRVGVVAMPTTMVYAKAGPAWMDVRGVEGFGTDFSQTLHGVLVGAGVESLVTPNVAVRLEGTYTHATDTLTLNQGSDLYHPNIMQVMFGAAYKVDIPGLGLPATVAAAPAAPLFTKAPAAAPVNWTGIELGGFASVNDDQMRYFGSNVGENGEQGPYANFRVGGGPFAGFNVQLSRLVVVGAEASANFQKADFNDANGVGFAPTIFHFASIDSVYAVSFRAGWLVTPETLLYAKVGRARIRVTPDSAYWNAIAPNPTTQAITVDGYQYGGGIETYLTQFFSIRVEGLYTASELAAGQLVFQGIPPNTFQLKPSLLTGTLGAGFHF